MPSFLKDRRWLLACYVTIAMNSCAAPSALSYTVLDAEGYKIFSDVVGRLNQCFPGCATMYVNAPGIGRQTRRITVEFSTAEVVRRQPSNEILFGMYVPAPDVIYIREVLTAQTPESRRADALPLARAWVVALHEIGHSLGLPHITGHLVMHPTVEHTLTTESPYTLIKSMCEALEQRGLDPCSQ